MTATAQLAAMRQQYLEAAARRTDAMGHLCLVLAEVYGALLGPEPMEGVARAIAGEGLGVVQAVRVVLEVAVSVAPEEETARLDGARGAIEWCRETEALLGRETPTVEELRRGIRAALRALEAGAVHFASEVLAKTIDPGARAVWRCNETKPVALADGIWRRCRIDLLTPAEMAVYDALQAVERLGADERLTQAVCLLQEARGRVADYVESVPGVRGEAAAGLAAETAGIGETR